MSAVCRAPGLNRSSVLRRRTGLAGLQLTFRVYRYNVLIHSTTQGV